MIREILASATCCVVLGVVGCAHHEHAMSTPTTAPATAPMATTMPAMTAMPATPAMPTTTGSESMMDKAKDMIKKGEAMLMKGTADGNPDEQSSGQKMIEQGKALLAKAKGMMGQ